MAGHSLIYATTILAFSLCISNCKTNHNSSGIIDGMSHYDRLLEKMDFDSIALQYTPDGELGDVAKGRDTIRNFLKKFSEYRVLSNNSITDSIKIFGDTAIQKGTYKQVTILPTKDTAHIKGQFETHWIWNPKDGWKISRMTTKPIQ